MRIRITMDGGIVATGTLDDTASAGDFAALLPLDLVLEDYAATEKIADLPRALSTAGAPEAHTPHVGDICFYAPWGNLAIFHRDGQPSDGLVRLGRLDSGVEVLRRVGASRVRVALVGA